jgi:hypothetical protein
MTMKTLIITVVCFVLSLGVASLKAGEVNDQACKETIANTCTKCHGAARICNKLKDDGMDAEKWRTIVVRMGKKASLAQDVQDSVHACLTTSADPGKLVCE